MTHNNIIFAIISIIVVIVFLIIFFRIWEIVKPYVILARNVIKAIDIIKDFTVNVALTLLNLIKDVVTGIFRVFYFDDVAVIALNNTVDNIDTIIDELTFNILIESGKRVVITTIGKTSKNAINFANRLIENLVPVSLVLFDPVIDSNVKIDDKIHVINIKSKDLNVSIKSIDITRTKNKKMEYNIIKPESNNVNSYMTAVKNGFI